MSHLATVECVIKDLDAVESACKELGWTLHRGVNKFQMFYSDQKGDCTHMIEVPGASMGMQLGLVEQPDGTFHVGHDDMMHIDDTHMNKESGLCGFLPNYEAAVTRKFLVRKGIRFTEKREGNKFVFQGVAS